jgi:hypothetical protein
MALHRVAPTVNGDHGRLDQSLYYIIQRSMISPGAGRRCHGWPITSLGKAPGRDSLRLKRKVAAWDDEFLVSLVAARSFRPILLEL